MLLEDGDVVDEVPDGEALEEARLLGLEAEAAAGCRGDRSSSVGVEAEDAEVPPSGAATVARIRSRVVLPAPLGPRRPVTPGLDGRGHAVEHGAAAVALGQRRSRRHGAGVNEAHLTDLECGPAGRDDGHRGARPSRSEEQLAGRAEGDEAVDERLGAGPRRSGKPEGGARPARRPARPAAARPTGMTVPSARAAAAERERREQPGEGERRPAGSAIDSEQDQRHGDADDRGRDRSRTIRAVGTGAATVIWWAGSSPGPNARATPAIGHQRGDHEEGGEAGPAGAVRRPPAPRTPGRRCWPPARTP